MPRGVPLPGYRADVLTVISDVLAGHPAVTPGKMFGLPGFYTAGKLFACLYGDGIAVKLPPGRVADLLGTPDCEPFAPTARAPMRAWVLIRRPTAEAYADDLPLLLASVEHVADEAVSGRGVPRRRRAARR